MNKRGEKMICPNTTGKGLWIFQIFFFWLKVNSPWVWWEWISLPDFIRYSIYRWLWFYDTPYFTAGPSQILLGFTGPCFRDYIFLFPSRGQLKNSRKSLRNNAKSMGIKNVSGLARNDVFCYSIHKNQPAS